jgi:hypothetical protein
MQLFALSTGSAVAGALSMFFFSLGTVPLMFGLGALSSLLTRRFTQKVMTAGSVLVLILGLSMFANGWTLSGFSLDGVLGAPVAATSVGSAASKDAGAAGAAGVSGGGAQASESVVQDGVQKVSTTLESGRYQPISVQAGIPVKWTIDVPEGGINGCNNRMIIPEYGIEHPFEIGENIVEFTPSKSGKFTYSCWMGMIRSSITVVY